MISLCGTRRACNSTFCGMLTMLWTLFNIVAQVSALPESPHFDEFRCIHVNDMNFQAAADEICKLRKQTHELEVLVSIYKLKIDTACRHDQHGNIDNRLGSTVRMLRRLMYFYVCPWSYVGAYKAMIWTRAWVKQGGIKKLWTQTCDGTLWKRLLRRFRWGFESAHKLMIQLYQLTYQALLHAQAMLARVALNPQKIIQALSTNRHLRFARDFIIALMAQISIMIVYVKFPWEEIWKIYGRIDERIIPLFRRVVKSMIEAPWPAP